MGNIHKIDNEYYIEFYARGLKYQQRAGRDLSAAQKLLQEIEAKIAKGETATLVRDVDVDIFLKDFLEYATAQYPAATRERYQALTRHFAQFLKNKFPQLKKLSLVTPSVMEEYKTFLMKSETRQGRKLKPHLVNFSLLLLSDVLEYSRKLGYLNDNPGLHIRFVPTGRVRNLRIPSDREMTQLIKTAPVDLAYLIEFAAATGCIIKELVNLQWPDVNWKENYIQIKNSYLRKRTVPLAGRGLEILKISERHRDPQSLFIFCDHQGQKRKTEQLQEQLPEVSFAALRHRFARDLIQRHISLQALNTLLGFSDVARVVFYLGFFEDRKKNINSSPLSL